jgi:hypothetical protein
MGRTMGYAGGLAIVVTLLTAAPGPAAEAPAPANGCVACHTHLPEGTRISHRHEGFIGSVHDRAGLGCDACHGGDPAASDKAAAHVGVKPASDPESSVYFTTVPRTCGRCHRAELAGFTRSRHFAQLQESGRGPNCVTCHGSMATRVLTAEQVDDFCVVCHNPRLGILPEKPQEAEATLRLVAETRTVVDWTRDLVAAARAAGKDTARAERELTAAEAEMAGAATAWHTFDLHAVRERMTRAFNAATAAKSALP